MAEARTSVSSGVQRGAFERGRLCADLGGPDACSRSLRSVLTFLVDSPLAMAGASEASYSAQPFGLSINQTATNRGSLVEKSAFRLEKTKRK